MSEDVVPETDTELCHSCGSAVPLKKYRGPCVGDKLFGEPEGSSFCDICSGTFLSHHVTYPRLYGNQHHLFSSIGYIANQILAKLDAIEKKLDRLEAK